MNCIKKKELHYAFLKSIPVMCGYLFLGISFGILLQSAGYNFIWAFFISLFVYAGSMQFIMVPMLVSAVSPLTMVVTTLFVNSRHIFYGLSFVEAFSKIKAKLYMIFSLTDETFSIFCSCRSEDPEKKHLAAWFWISALDHFYWIVGSVVGACLGEALPFDFTGIDFSMSAFFIVILMEQVLGKPKQAKIAAIVGISVSGLCLIIFGTDKFLLPALLITVFLLSGYSFRDSKNAKKEDLI
ncbi:MAG TPA: AzlC family ABC transporter permease [Lachnospiraceae bacterium]|nr:AzlC family ABC transporter permease [Lachnospiraceae bacterium]